MKNPTVKSIIRQLERFAPPTIAPFDYEGILVDSGKTAVTKIALTLDATLDAIEKAISNGCDFLITHHGPDDKGFHSIRGLDAQRIHQALQSSITIYRMHLNLDFCRNGIQKKFCQLLGFDSVSPVRVMYEGHVLDPGAFISTEPLSLSEAIQRVKRLNPETLRVLTTGKSRFQRIALTAGAGFVPSFLEQLQPDLFISGELNHIAIVRALDLGITLIEATHASSESEPLKLLAPEFERMLGVPVYFIDSKSRHHLRSIG